MLRLPLSRAAPGMVIALPVLHPEKTEHVLLKPGAVLDPPALAGLRELGVWRLWIDYPPTKYLLQYASPALIAEHGRLASRLAECFDTIVQDTHAELDFLPYADGVRSFIGKLLEDAEAAVFLDGFLDSRRTLVTHSSNVCMLSILIGLKLDGYLVAERPRLDPRRAMNIENLGVGALFHDVGMLRLSKDVLRRWRDTHDEADPAWQKHAVLGYDTVRGKVAPTAAGVVLHHHQRIDGSGFPKKARLFGPARPLSGGEIHVFARIVGMAEAFERFRAPEVSEGGASMARGRRRAGGPPPDEPPRGEPAVRALKGVLGLVRAGKLDPVVFKALLAVAPAFPPGGEVELSDGRRALVGAWHPARPCSPTVLPLIGTPDPRAVSADRVLGKPIDLRKRPDLSIRAIDGVDVRDDLFWPRSAAEFDLRRQFGLLDQHAEAVSAAG